MNFRRTLSMILIFAFVGISGFCSSFETWADEFVEELKVDILQNAYARRLVFPKKDRIPTVAMVGDSDTIIFSNIHDSNDLWTGRFRRSQLKSAEIMNIPIPPGAFHFASLFHFKEPIIITNSRGESKKTLGLLMGTGPEKDFSVQGVTGFQLIQMRAYSIEYYESIAPIQEKYRHTVNTKKVDIDLFFLAHAEETARLAAMTYLRALIAENPRMGDNPIFQKFNFFGANCVASGIQNLARAIRPEFHKPFLKLGRKDISKMEPLNSQKFLFWIQSWHEVALQALGGMVGRSPNRQKFAQLEKFHKQLRSTNQMSLPWRAKPLIDWATR